MSFTFPYVYLRSFRRSLLFVSLSMENLIFSVSTANIKQPSAYGSYRDLEKPSNWCNISTGHWGNNLKHYSSSKLHFRTQLPHSDCQVTRLRILGAKEVPDVSYNLLGQYCVLQVRVLSLSPLQSFPPLEGGGLLQLLVILCVPPPHVFVHSFHRLQLPQFPFTVSSKSSDSSDNNSVVWFYCVISLASCKPDVNSWRSLLYSTEAPLCYFEPGKRGKDGPKNGNGNE